LVKAADMMIARRADTRARADFATWKMMAKLNGADALPPEAQNFLASYRELLGKMPEDEATEATINLLYKTYFAQMGGVGTPPDVRPGGASQPVKDNVTAFRRPAARGARPAASSGVDARPRLPVALIFVCLVVVYVAIRYLLR
jgi:hypothetical protein